MTEFLAMGGYGAFVWPSYAAAFAGLGILIWRSLAARKRARRLVAQLEEGHEQ